MIKIGISCRITSEHAYIEQRNSLALDWIKFCENVGFFPVLIPNGLSDVHNYCESLELDGIILSGGNNISPKLYQSEESLDDVYEVRDSTEHDLVKYGLRNNLPILGVCRGMFYLNAFFSGKLTHFVVGHVGELHRVKFDSYTNFFSKVKRVNSYHNHVIRPDDLAKELIPFARCDDGFVEAFKHTSLPIFGLLWHPERAPIDIETQHFIFSIFKKES